MDTRRWAVTRALAAKRVNSKYVLISHRLSPKRSMGEPTLTTNNAKEANNMTPSGAAMSPELN